MRVGWKSKGLRLFTGFCRDGYARPVRRQGSRDKLFSVVVAGDAAEDPQHAAGNPFPDPARQSELAQANAGIVGRIEAAVFAATAGFSVACREGLDVARTTTAMNGGLAAPSPIITVLYPPEPGREPRECWRNREPERRRKLHERWRNADTNSGNVCWRNEMARLPTTGGKN